VAASFSTRRRRRGTPGTVNEHDESTAPTCPGRTGPGRTTFRRHVAGLASGDRAVRDRDENAFGVFGRRQRVRLRKRNADRGDRREPPRRALKRIFAGWRGRREGGVKQPRSQFGGGGGRPGRGRRSARSVAGDSAPTGISTPRFLNRPQATRPRSIRKARSPK